ncbi:MAG: energy transducer TonB [Gemmatimonadaceae bacterium]
MLENGELVQWWRSVVLVNWKLPMTVDAGGRINLGTRQFTHAQFCTAPEPLIGAAAFANDDPPRSPLPAVSPNRVYRAAEVDKPASLRPGQLAPEYPNTLRMARTTGVVNVQFVIDTTGRVAMRTFRVIKSDQPEFAESVRAALTKWTFTPAELNGVKVRVLVEEPFTFGPL